MTCVSKGWLFCPHSTPTPRHSTRITLTKSSAAIHPCPSLSILVHPCLPQLHTLLLKVHALTFINSPSTRRVIGSLLREQQSQLLRHGSEAWWYRSQCLSPSWARRATSNDSNANPFPIHPRHYMDMQPPHAQTRFGNVHGVAGNLSHICPRWCFDVFGHPRIT